jgi:hypothetical protein
VCLGGAMCEKEIIKVIAFEVLKRFYVNLNDYSVVIFYFWNTKQS